MLSKSVLDLKRGLSLYHVWLYQAYHEVSAKYKRTFLGSLWISGAMVATSLALAIVMGGIMQVDLAKMLPYTMAGIICFALMGYVLTDAPEAFMQAANIIKNHAYPYTYYTFEGISRTFVVFIHNIVVFYITVLILRQFVVPHWQIVPALVLVSATMFFWGSMASMAAARFRDLRFLLPFMSQIIFFLTPVFWHAESVSGWRSYIVHANPFYGLLEIVRAPLLGNAAPFIAWQLSLVTLGVGIALWTLFFSLNRGKIAFWI